MVLVGPKPRIGQKVECKNCKTMLEVSWLDPLELDWPYKPDKSDLEGYDDYEDDDYEYEEEEYEDYDDEYDYDYGEED
jgi:hypothetical protein